jgi:manganese/zinc/iron transport system substrate-binding protein
MKILQATILAFFLSIIACSNPSPSETKQLGDRFPVKVVCTTGMVADLVQNIMGDIAEVEALMGPGVDPHLYKPTQGDLNKLTSADIIIYNGLHLEGKMQSILEKMGQNKPVYAITSSLDKSDLITVSEDKLYDPHVWFNVSLWRKSIDGLHLFLSEKIPSKKEYLLQRSSKYGNQLRELQSWVSKTIAEIPEENRALVTSHDAFGYFGDAYDVEVKGLQGISTVTEFGLKDVTNMVDFIIENDIKAVFVESSMPRKPLQAVIKGCAEKGQEVREGGLLYSDAMGEAGTPEGTYIGMVRHNVNTIHKALK